MIFPNPLVRSLFMQCMNSILMPPKEHLLGLMTYMFKILLLALKKIIL